jgi:two-component system, NtrC family, response regulator AtoC
MSLARTSWSVDARDLPPLGLIFGKSSGMSSAREMLDRVADKTVPVLIQGESGTGKDIVAKLLHLNSARANGPWVKVSCPAIPHALIESELFGYEKGAFTGAYATKRGRVELAHMGTLFLDEVGGLDMQVQAKLLQLLQDGSFTRVGGSDLRSVNTRFVSAANGSLKQQVDEGTFRLDFFFRINAVTIDLPPLRERAEDIPAFVDYFMEVHSKIFKAEPRPMSREILRMMQRYSWPGNIRQLENLVRSYILVGDEEVLASELVSPGPSRVIPEIDLDKPISLKEITKAATRNLEREIILRVLQANGWSRRKTAKWLNISYRSLLYKLQDTLSNPTKTE